MDEREAAIRAAAEHVERMRRRLEQGKQEIERQQASIGGTREHLAGMRRWLEDQEAGDYDDAA